MPSSLFANSAKPTNTKRNNTGMAGMIEQLGKTVSLLKSTNPEEAADRLAAINPEFAKFRERYQHASLDQVAQDMGIDVNSIRAILQALGL